MMPLTPDPPADQLYTRPFTIAVISQMGFVLANLMMAHYARWIAYLGGSESDIGWITGVGAFGALLLRPWLGQWLNRLGARNVWFLGCGLFLVGTLGNLWVHDLGWLIYALRTCLILGVACVSSSSLMYISQIAPAHRQAEAIGILGVGGFVGFIFGPYLGDLIIGSGARSRGDFLFLFWAAAGVVVLSMIMLAFLQETRTTRPPSAVRLSDFALTVAKHWPGSVLLVMFLFGVCMTVPLAFLARFIDEARLSIPGVSIIGLFFLFYALIGLTLRIGFRQLPDRIGRRKVLLLGMAVMAAGMFSFRLVDATQPWFLIVPALLCGAGHALMFHTGTALILEAFPTEVRGTGSALAFMMLDLGSMIGSPILGWIADEHGFAWLFIAVGGACLGVGAVFLGCLLVSRQTREKR
jgi:MFS family permease